MSYGSNLGYIPIFAVSIIRSSIEYSEGEGEGGGSCIWCWFISSPTFYRNFVAALTTTFYPCGNNNISPPADVVHTCTVCMYMYYWADVGVKSQNITPCRSSFYRKYNDNSSTQPVASQSIFWSRGLITNNLRLVGAGAGSVLVHELIDAGTHRNLITVAALIEK